MGAKDRVAEMLLSLREKKSCWPAVCTNGGESDGASRRKGKGWEFDQGFVHTRYRYGASGFLRARLANDNA